MGRRPRRATRRDKTRECGCLASASASALAAAIASLAAFSVACFFARATHGRRQTERMARPAILESPLVASDDWYSDAPVLDGTVTEAKQEWEEILELFRRGKYTAAMLEQTRVKKALMSTGIPASLRPKIWLAFSGASERLEANPEVFDELCSQLEVNVGGDTSDTAGGGAASQSSSSILGTEQQQAKRRVLEQIEKDLRRTEVGSDGGMLRRLRRVLSAYASHNPEVGYVQGMNFIAVALLRVLDEPQTFWMLVVIVERWLPDHFSHAMVGNHIDCRVLATLTSEHLPRLSMRLAELDISVQLLTTRWFLCLWASVLPVRALHRLWDLLFVTGPAATMQVALACMHLCDAPTADSSDIGDALTSVKDVLRMSGDGGQLVEIALCRVAPISEAQLRAWRQHTRQIVVREHRHVHATRRLHKLTRQSGFSMHELKLLARVGGPFTLMPSDAAPSLLRLSVDYDGFVRVVAGLVPQWHNDGGERSLVRRLFEIFLRALPADSRGAAELELDRRDMGGWEEAEPTRGGDVSSNASDANGGGGANGDVGGEARGASEAGPSAADPIGGGGTARLTFEQLVRGLGWLLRGTSEQRAKLCYRCFADDGCDGGAGSALGSAASDEADDGPGGGGSGGGSSGASGDPPAAGTGVRFETFRSLLASVYLMYESGGSPAPGQLAGRRAPPSDEATHAHVQKESDHFVRMMFDLYAPPGSAVMLLDEASFNRAAHQHPLLVQAFQLVQLDAPPGARPAADAAEAEGCHGGTPRSEAACGEQPEPASASSPMADAAPLGFAHLRIKNGVYVGLRPGAVSIMDDSYFGD